MRVNPDELLLEVKNRFKTERAKRNLENVHETCRGISDAPGAIAFKDYSIVAVAKRLAINKKSPSYNTLRATAGAHFRELIRAWAVWDGTDRVEPAQNSETFGLNNKLLSKISDLALRSLIAFEFARGREALSELNTLKGQTTLTIDIRPKDGTSLAQSPNAGDAASAGTVSRLHNAERDSLGQALDQRHLLRFGLTIGVDGEIKTVSGGRVLFSAGFATGLKKLLD